MDPRRFLEVVVKPNVAEFASDYGSLRLAFNAVLAVDALAAHLYFWCKSNAHARTTSNDGKFRDLLATRSPDYYLVRHIANAQKHVELDRRNPPIRNVSQVQPQTLGWDDARWDAGRWDSPVQVIVITDAGEKRVVETLVKRALTFLENEMKTLGCR